MSTFGSIISVLGIIVAIFGAIFISNKSKRNKAIITLFVGLIISVIGFQILNKNDTSNTKNINSQKKTVKTTPQGAKKNLNFSFANNIYNTDGNGKVVIKGKIDKGASVDLNSAPVNVDEKGNVTYETKLNKKIDQLDLTFTGTKAGYEDDQKTITIKNISNERKQYVIDKKKKEAYKRKHTPKDDTVYGTLTETYNYTEEMEDLYKDEENDIMYSTVENDKIYQVAIGLGDDSNFDLLKDKPYLIKLAKKYMQGDSKLIQTISDKSFIYKSDGLNKKYNVDFEVNDDNKVFEVLITHYVPQ